jgi:hypothetical protein
MYRKRGDPLGSYGNLEAFIKNLTHLPDESIEAYLEGNTELDNGLTKTAVHVLQTHGDYHAKNYYVVRSGDPPHKWDAYFFDFDRFWGCQQRRSTPCYPIDYDPKRSGTKFNSRIWKLPGLEQRFLHVLWNVTENILTEEAVFSIVDDWFERTRRDRRDEQRTGRNIVAQDESLPRMKSHFDARRKWILEQYLPARGFSVPEKLPPTLTLAVPQRLDSGDIAIHWTHRQTTDKATVQLYWTDMGFSHFVPIPGATTIAVGSNGRGSFVWKHDVPDIQKGRIYIHAVMSDPGNPLVGRATSVPIR